MIPILNIAIRAVRKAGNLTIQGFEKINHVFHSHENKYKKYFINKINQSIEREIIKIIFESYPQHSILAKNIGDIIGIDQSVQWIIDPVNGITNYSNGFPHFAMSIAIKVKKRTEVAVIYDAIKNELFSVVRGKNAQINGYRLRVKQTKKLYKSIIISNCIFFKNNVNQKIYFRNTGSPSLDLSYLSAGRIDCYIASGLKNWDLVAGELLTRESGGVITDFTGNNNYLSSGNIIAGNVNIVKEVLLLINKKN